MFCGLWLVVQITDSLSGCTDYFLYNNVYLGGKWLYVVCYVCVCWIGGGGMRFNIVDPILTGRIM